MAMILYTIGLCFCPPISLARAPSACTLPGSDVSSMQKPACVKLIFSCATYKHECGRGK